VAEISTLRGTVNITHLSGDTLTISVKTPSGSMTGLEWAAQVRATTGDPDVAADFVITLPAAPGDPAFLVLSSDDTSRLAPDGGQFSGVWDCQVSAPGGGDPVTTLCGGKLTLKPDVTRAVVP
jgi:hypothetical protein